MTTLIDSYNGLKYFATDNSGTTVDGNGVVTFGTNAAIPEATMLGGHGMPARTNLVFPSNDLSTWTNDYTPVVTLNQLTAPDGTVTLAKLANAGGNAYEGKYKQITVANSTAYAAQFEWSGGDSLLSRFSLYNQTAAAFEFYITIARTGSVPSTSASSGASSIAYTLNPVTGTYNVSFLFTSSASAASQMTKLYIQPDLNNTSKYIYAGRFQVEAGTYPTNYIETTSGTVSRTAITDADVWPAGLGNNFKIKFDLIIKGIPTTTNQYIFGCGTAANNVQLYIDYTTSKLNFVVTVSSVAYTVTANAAAAINTSYAIELIYNNGMSMVINSVTQTDTDAVASNMGWSDPEILYLYASYNNDSNSFCTIKNKEIIKL